MSLTLSVLSPSYSSLCLSLSLSVDLYICLSFSPSLSLSICISVCLTLPLSICRSVYLSVFLSLSVRYTPPKKKKKKKKKSPFPLFCPPLARGLRCNSPLPLLSIYLRKITSLLPDPFPLCSLLLAYCSRCCCLTTHPTPSVLTTSSILFPVLLSDHSSHPLCAHYF